MSSDSVSLVDFVDFCRRMGLGLQITMRRDPQPGWWATIAIGENVIAWFVGVGHSPDAALSDLAQKLSGKEAIDVRTRALDPIEFPKNLTHITPECKLSAGMIEAKEEERDE